MKYIFYLSIVLTLTISSCKKTDVVSNDPATSAGNNLATGKSANDILSAAKYSSMNVEVLFMPGFAPDAAALNNLANFINGVANKPAGINFSQRQIPASGKSTLTLEEIVTIEKANRTTFNSGTSLAVCVLYVDADYNQPNTIGVAYRNTSLAIFGKTVLANSGGINQVSRTKLETTGLNHEFGHIMGLVNLGTNMVTQHEDAGHLKHCNNSACLMYFATQTNMMGGVILSGPVPPLDANCMADLRANGGK